MNSSRLAGITALLLLACAKRGEVSPHAMSQAAHDAATEAHAADAANHEAEYSGQARGVHVHLLGELLLGQSRSFAERLQPTPDGLDEIPRRRWRSG